MQVELLVQVSQFIIHNAQLFPEIGLIYPLAQEVQVPVDELYMLQPITTLIKVQLATPEAPQNPALHAWH